MDPGRKPIALFVAAGATIAVLAAGLAYVGRNGLPGGLVAPAGHSQVSPRSAGGAHGPVSAPPSVPAQRSGGASGTGAEGRGAASAPASGVHPATPRVHTSTPNGLGASTSARTRASIHLTFPRHWRPTTYEIGPAKPRPPVTLVSPVPLDCAACPPNAVNH